MLPKTKAGTIRTIKACIRIIEDSEMYGIEAVEVSDCLQFLQGWLKMLSDKDLKKIIQKRKKALKR